MLCFQGQWLQSWVWKYWREEIGCGKGKNKKRDGKDGQGWKWAENPVSKLFRACISIPFQLRESGEWEHFAEGRQRMKWSCCRSQQELTVGFSVLELLLSLMSCCTGKCIFPPLTSVAVEKRPLGVLGWSQHNPGRHCCDAFWKQNWNLPPPALAASLSRSH